MRFLFMNSHPFNVSDCNECITEVKNVRQYNSSIVKLFNTLDNMCETLNLTECVSGLQSAEHWLLEGNSTKVCQDLGFCDNLTIDNYIMSIDTNLHLFRYYNKLLAMNNSFGLNISDNSLYTNFTTEWEYVLDEPLVDISTISLENEIYTGICYLGKSTNYDLLRVQTESYIHYLNFTTRKSIKSIYTSSQVYKSFILDNLNYSYFNEIYKNSSIIDSFTNGTNYLVVGNWLEDSQYSISFLPLITKVV